MVTAAARNTKRSGRARASSTGAICTRGFALDNTSTFLHTTFPRATEQPLTDFETTCLPISTICSHSNSPFFVHTTNERHAMDGGLSGRAHTLRRDTFAAKTSPRCTLRGTRYQRATRSHLGRAAPHSEDFRWRRREDRLAPLTAPPASGERVCWLSWHTRRRRNRACHIGMPRDACLPAHWRSRCDAAVARGQSGSAMADLHAQYAGGVQCV